MKNHTKSLLVLVLSTLIATSCVKEIGPTTSSSINIDFHVSEHTSKASAPCVDEDVINNVKLFVYQIDQSSGATAPFAEYYTETGNIAVDLPFPGDSSYEYSIRAYANFGDITDEPEYVEFKDCFEDGMKMHGEGKIDESNVRTGSVSILLKRYVGKVMVNSIGLFGTEKLEKSMSINAIYIANVGADNSSESESMYNPDGNVVESEVSQYIYDSLENVTLKYGERYTGQHHFYGLNGYSSAKPTALIIQTTYDERTLYYQIDLDFRENYCAVYDFVIIGAGTDVPYGNKQDMSNPSIIANTSILSPEGWTTIRETVYSEEVSYGNSDVTTDTGWE